MRFEETSGCGARFNFDFGSTTKPYFATALAIVGEANRISVIDLFERRTRR
jgi:hypothetical protein